MPITQYVAGSTTWNALDGSDPITPGSTPTGWPDATNTGVTPGTSLLVVGTDITSGPGWHSRDIGSGSSSIQIDAEGANLIGFDIPGGVYNPNGFGTTTIRNCRIHLIGWTDGSAGVTIGPGSTIQDTEIGAGANGNTRVRSSGITSTGTQAKPNLIQRVHVHKTTHCIHTGSDTTVRDSWLHDVSMGDTDLPNMAGDHTEAVFITNGQRMDFEHCRLDSGNTAVFFAQNFNHTADGTGLLTINNCKFEAIAPRNSEWSNSAIIIENKMINGAITVTNNVFDGPAPAGAYPQDTWMLGYVISVPETVSTVSGNTYVGGASADGSGSAIFVPVVY